MPPLDLEPMICRPDRPRTSWRERLVRAVSRRTVAALSLAIAAAGQPDGEVLAQPPAAQLPTEITQVRFNSGQAVVPYFEGWIKNPDGTFDLVFGYFNRNWTQTLAVAAGPGNKVEPGGPDSGQPTFFLPRRQRFVFRVRVPADFGKKEVAWSITANGHTEQGYGNLMPAQEITERVVMTNGNFNPGRGDTNQPPSIAIDPEQTATAGVPLTLTASVTDDGLPKIRPAAVTRTGTQSPGFGAQVNTTVVERPRGLTVSWLEYRGPAKAAFAPGGPTPVADGKGATAVTFEAPGTYDLRVTVNDGALSTRKHITVTVRPAPSTP